MHHLPSDFMDRRAVLQVDERCVLDLLRLPAEQLCVPEWSGLPEDVNILGVHSDPLRRAFFFVLQHQGFVPVAPGASLPVLDARYRLIALQPKPATTG